MQCKSNVREEWQKCKRSFLEETPLRFVCLKPLFCLFGNFVYASITLALHSVYSSIFIFAKDPSQNDAFRSGIPWPAAGREAVMSRRGKLGSVVAMSTFSLPPPPPPILASRSAGKKESEQAHALRVGYLRSSRSTASSRCTCVIARRDPPIPFI